ncbi:MAG: hypothetical protein DRP79_04810 [Planctomycetota bacterium]|nr:MAG: hypothetical protein DRP79_04810 [Planctomycetota bacterium]
MYHSKIALPVVALVCMVLFSRAAAAVMASPSKPDDDLMELVKKKDVDGLIALWLKDAERGVRKDGMYSGALLSLESEKIVPAFIKAYETKNERIMAQSFSILACLDRPDELLKVVLRVREIETENFGMIPEELKKKVEELVENLDADEFEVRDKAKKELIALGGRCAGILEKYRNHPSIEVRYSVEQILRTYKKSGDVAKPPELSRGAKTELMALLKIVKPDDACRIARTVLQAKYPNRLMLKQSLLILTEYGKPADAAIAGGYLHHKQSDVRKAAIQAVAKTGGKEYIDAIRELLNNRTYAPTAALALARLGDKDSIEIIKKADVSLRQKRGESHEKYLQALLLLGDGKYIERELDSDTPESAIVAIGEAGERRYLGKVLEIFETSGTGYELLVTAEYLLKLSNKGNKEVFAAIRKRASALKPVSPQLYEKLTVLLLQYGEDEAVSMVRSMLKSEDVVTRKNAIDLIRKSGNAKLAPYLRPLLDDKATFRIFAGLGGYRTVIMGQYATDAICGFAGARLGLWRFDPDRQRREIDKWFEANFPEK